MTYTILLEPEASTDIQEAIDWYNSQQRGRGATFYNEVQKGIDRLSTFPFFQVRYDKVMRCLPLKGFPYMIHFSVNEEKAEVTIKAVFHTSKNPKSWINRLKT